MTKAEVAELAQLLECDPDFHSLSREVRRRNRERDRMRKTIADLRAGRQTQGDADAE